MIKKVKLNNTEYSIIINKKKIKHTYFRIDNDLNIVVNANSKLSDKKILKILYDNKKSIINMHAKKENQIKNNLSYLGKKLQYKYSNDTYIDKSTIYSESEDKANDYIYSLANDYLKKRVYVLKKDFYYVPDFTLKFKTLKSKWGSCNRKTNTVTLNKELIKKRPDLIDYVIIHELVHFKYLGHNKYFWNEVSCYFKDYKKARKEINY